MIRKQKYRIMIYIGLGFLLVGILVAVISNNSTTSNVEKGEIHKGVYTNKLFEISFTAPDGFEFASEKQINELKKTSASQQDKGSMLENWADIDMMASNDNTGEAISIMVTDSRNSVLDTTQNQEDAIEGFKKYFKQNSEDGLFDIVYQGEAKLGGMPYYQVTVLYDYEGIPIIADTYFRKKDKYIISIQVLVIDEVSMDTNQLKNSFKRFK